VIDIEAFDVGMNRLAILPLQSGAAEVDLAVRKVAYYEALSPTLNTAEWRAVVHEAFTECSWFPTPKELLDIWRGMAPTVKFLPSARRTEAEKEQARQDMRKGLEMIQQEMAKRGLPVPEIKVIR
jgi:hypothetical protein